MFVPPTGITRGQMQNWQLDLSKTAAMAALLAGNASWWMLESLLSPLSAQAAAGVKPQLLPLMQVRLQPSLHCHISSLRLVMCMRLQHHIP